MTVTIRPSEMLSMSSELVEAANRVGDTERHQRARRGACKGSTARRDSGQDHARARGTRGDSLSRNTMERAIYTAQFDVTVSNTVLELIYTTAEKLTAADAAIMLDLVQRGAGNHETPAALSQLAADCGISKMTVCRSLNRLRGRGLIVSEHTHGDHAPALISLGMDRGNFTIVPREAFTACMELIRGKRLSFTALRLLAFVWRNTYGYRGKHGAQSTPNSTFSDSFIKNGTGIQRGHAYNALKELRSVGAVNVTHDIAYYRGVPSEIKVVTAQAERFLQAADGGHPATNMLHDPATNTLHDPATNMLHDDFDLEIAECAENAGRTEPTAKEPTGNILVAEKIERNFDDRGLDKDRLTPACALTHDKYPLFNETFKDDSNDETITETDPIKSYLSEYAAAKNTTVTGSDTTTFTAKEEVHNIGSTPDTETPIEHTMETETKTLSDSYAKSLEKLFAEQTEEDVKEFQRMSRAYCLSPMEQLAAIADEPTPRNKKKFSS